MITSLKSKANGLVVGGLALTSAFFYWQHVSGERDSYQAEAKHQRERAEILQEHQRFQREQIQTLNEAMAVRDQTLTAIREDISASTRALEQLGDRDAEARDWMDSDLPIGIADWVRELQHSADGDAVLRARGSGSPNE